MTNPKTGKSESNSNSNNPPLDNHHSQLHPEGERTGEIQESFNNFSLQTSPSSHSPNRNRYNSSNNPNDISHLTEVAFLSHRKESQRQEQALRSPRNQHKRDREREREQV